MQKEEVPLSSNADLNLVEVLNYLYSHKWFVITVAVASAAIAGVWTSFFSSPVYQSTATIVYNNSMSANPLERETSSFWSDQAQIENKLFILGIFFNSAKFRDVFVNEVYPPRDVAAEPADTSNSDDIGPIADDVSQTDYFRKVLRILIKKQKLKTRGEIGSYLAGLASLSIDQQKRSIYITGQNGAPLIAQAAAHLAARAFVQLNYEDISKEMNAVVAFIEQQTEITKNRLYSLEDELAALQKNQKILSVDQTSSAIDHLQVENEAAVSNLSVEKAHFEMWITAIEKSIQDFRNDLKNGIDSPMYMVQLQRRIDLLFYQRSLSSNKGRGIASIDEGETELSLDAALDEFQKSFDLMRKTNMSTDPWAYLRNLEANLSKAKEKLFEAETKIAARKKVTFASEQKYNTLPTVLKTITQLRRNIEVTSGLYQQLKTKLQETQILRASKSNDLIMVQPAEFPGEAIGLTISKRIAFSFIGGLGFIVLLLIVRFVLLPTIRNGNDLKKIGIEVLAEIPFVRIFGVGNINIHYPLLLKSKSSHNEANAIRQARFNIEEKLSLNYNSSKEANAKIVAVSSSDSAEGKSFTAANLAHALSLAQFRVVLLDLDVLNPSVRKYFRNTEPSKEINLGLSDLFVGYKVDDFLTLVDIPGKTTMITDILETRVLSDLINSLRPTYDIIIIDTPPLRSSLEPRIASRYADAMVLVANQRRTLKHDIYKTIDSLRETYKGRIFAILNFSYDEVNASTRRTGDKAA